MLAVRDPRFRCCAQPRGCVAESELLQLAHEVDRIAARSAPVTNEPSTARVRGQVGPSTVGVEWAAANECTARAAQLNSVSANHFDDRVLLSDQFGVDAHGSWLRAMCCVSEQTLDLPVASVKESRQPEPPSAHSAWTIHAESKCSSSADWRATFDKSFWQRQLEVLAPDQLARIKERSDQSGHWIDCADCGRLAQVARTARERQVVEFVQPFLGGWHDMVDLELEIEECLGSETVFATVPCPRGDGCVKPMRHP